MGKNWEFNGFLAPLDLTVENHNLLKVLRTKFRDQADRNLRGTFWKQESHRRAEI